MNTRPTPETDDATLIANDIEHGGNFNAVHVQVSKRLERERDEARDTVESLTTTASDLLTALGNTRNERDEARGQRDRLAAALDLCLARLEHHTEFGALVQSDMSAMHSAREALQSLTTNAESTRAENKP